MQITNDLMTEEQVTDLLNLAAELQAKAEASNDRDTAVMAYAVQKVCLELTESRFKSKASEQQLAAVVAENAGLKQSITTHSQSTHFCEVCGKDDPCSTDDVCYAQKETPATDAFLAEVRAQGADEVAATCRRLADKDGCSVNMRCSYNLTAERAEAIAAQLRQGAAL